MSATTEKPEACHFIRGQDRGVRIMRGACENCGRPESHPIHGDAAHDRVTFWKLAQAEKAERARVAREVEAERLLREQADMGAKWCADCEDRGTIRHRAGSCGYGPCCSHVRDCGMCARQRAQTAAIAAFLRAGSE